MQFVDILTVEKNDIVVEAAIMTVGNDWLIVVSGGNTPHIGAISFGNRVEEEKLALGTHKELAVTQKMLKELKEYCLGNLLITGGIHIDHITQEQINQVMEICDMLTEKIVLLINEVESMISYSCDNLKMPRQSECNPDIKNEPQFLAHKNLSSCFLIP